MINRELEVAAFNHAGGNADWDHGGSFGVQLMCFSEELAEFNQALADYVNDENEETRAAMIKEWADCQVTLSNFAWFFNFNGDEAFRRVSESNMSKTVEGELVKNDDGKILKGPNYEAPDMSGL